MSELGQLLKKARVDRGISLEDLQETTKIRKTYLEAIEEGNFKVLPGNFYVRAFIKSYAEAVGLDPNEVLLLYQNDIPQASPDTSIDSISPKRTVSKRSDRWSRWTTGIMVFTFFLLIAGLIYYFAYKNNAGRSDRTLQETPTHLTDKTATDTPAPSSTSPAATTEGKAAGQSPVPLTPEVAFVRSEKGIDFYQVKNAGGKLTVQLSLTGADCWFQIDRLIPNGDTFNHEMVEQGSLAKLGSPKQWESDKPVFLNIGLPTAVNLTVNGIAVPLGELSNPKKLQFELAAL